MSLDVAPGDGLHVERSGAGPPLVLLHGWALNLRVFDELARALEDRHTVIRIDLPGHGRSAEPATLREAGWSAAALAGALRAHVPAGAAILGWSLGGQVAIELAAAAPDAVSALVLVSATPRFLADADSGWSAGVAPAQLARLAAFLGRDLPATVRDFLELQVRGGRDADVVLHRLQQALHAHGTADAGALARGLGMLRESDLRARLERVSMPALVVGGQYDRVTPPAAARALQAALPQARHHEIARAGHAPFLSHGPQFAALLRTFLGDLPARGAARDSGAAAAAAAGRALA
jgi:pimeloyl-[acyl-carrier protein] methyl ester esterase